MGEYAIDQMMRDFKQATGFDAERSMFEDDDAPSVMRPKCPKCGKVFRVSKAVVDHMRDKHRAEPKKEQQP